MPFGLTNAPSTFQSFMNEIFKQHLRKFVLVFFDDILVYNKSWEEHWQHMRKVLSILRSHMLYAKKENCQFGQDHIKYLGHVISTKGVAVDMDKVHAMVDWPKPKTLKALRGFLGLTLLSEVYPRIRKDRSATHIPAQERFILMEPRGREGI